MCGFGYNRAGAPIVACSSNDEYAVFGHNDGVYEYHRGLLSNDEKILYDEIVESYLQFKDDLSTRVDHLTTEQLNKTFKYVILDHPEIFWINNYASANFYNSVRTDKIIKLNYYYNKKEAIKAKESIEKTSNDIIAQAKKYDLDEDKIKYVHDKLIELGTYTDYDKKSEGDFQSFISLFRDGKTVCSGFAYSFKYIMVNIGIPSIIIADINEDSDEESHIWNMVVLDGKVYNLDITYDNEISEERGRTAYTYFMLENPIFYLDHERQEDVPEYINEDLV